MKDDSRVDGLQVDVSDVLPAVGDRKSVRGAARLVLESGYDITFVPGDEVYWELEVRRIAGGVEVNGSISGVVNMICHRCLEGFEFTLSMSVREHALWLSEAEVDEEVEYASEYIVIDGMLDIEPILRDAICLVFPARRVCDESCKGLCARCGANLNLEPCGCDTTRVDARLKPLEELKKRLEAGGQ